MKSIAIKVLGIFAFVLFHTPLLFAQSQHAVLHGEVLSSQGKPLSGIYLYFKDAGVYTATDTTGHFSLSAKPGTYRLEVSGLGYQTLNRTVELKLGQKQNLEITLHSADVNQLGKVYLEGKSALEQVRESSFNVVAVNTEALHNTSLDVSEALNRVSGVHVRRSGGMGSNFNVMLNGFTGRHVKFFIDGVPMEGFNSAFQLNNMPVNLAKRIEVYKGVVPISFGSDALGGAINIVTAGEGRQNFIDASYSFGSFNTHKSFVNAAYTAKSGFTARLTAYQNYSDNNYKVDADILDLSTGLYSGDIRTVRRFHDMYRNYTLRAKVGFVNTSFADALLLGFTYGDEYDEIQNPAYMKIAFGQKYTTAKTLMPSLVYRKSNLFTPNLNVSLSANYNFGKAKDIDDSYRRYNWLGAYIETEAPGEFNYVKNHYTNHNGSVTANVAYTLAHAHHFTVNNVLSSFWRKSYDAAEPSPTDDYPRETLKDILGFAYKYQPDNRLSASIFSKYYLNKVSQYADPQAVGNYEEMEKTTSDLGYGLAASYFLTDNLQLKTSYEKAYRLPTGRELFGAGNDFQLGNPDLKPESSDNINFGINYTWQPAQAHVLTVDGSFIYRAIKDFIHQIPDPNNGVMRPGNEAKVSNKGVDLSLAYTYDQRLSINANLTYQEMRNKLKYASGKDVISTIYNDRIPNQPYLYGGANVSYNFADILQNTDRLTVTYALQYTHSFDYSYESYGGREIPTQVAHDIMLNYSFDNGRYNVSLAARNLLDENLYDNFSLQKPGRNFSIKLRYFLNQF